MPKYKKAIRRATRRKPKYQFLSSGGTLLDLVLGAPVGNGWAFGRIANLVGDKSSGKTLLAIEACANFALDYPQNDIAYREVESAFDRAYAESMGLPRGIDYNDEIRTIEDLERDLIEWLAAHKGPSLYIVDSLDALSTEAEMERKVGDASYGMEKAKAISQMLRKRSRDIERKNCLVLIISQIRDKINVRFGETKTRAGGHALDFYASQVIWLAETSKIAVTRSKVKRTVGITVRARNRKNKVGTPYRETGFTIMFGFGVDDERSMLDWIKENKGDDLLPRALSVYDTAIANAREDRDRRTMASLNKELRTAVEARWEEIEDAFKPPLKKYQ